MTTTHSFKHLQPILWFVGAVCLVIGVEHAATTSARLAQQPLLPVAVVLDVLVGLPLLFYFCLVRRYRLPLASLVGVVGACLALVHWLLPVAQRPPLPGLRWLPALLEAATLLGLATKGRRLLGHYRAAYQHEGHFWPSLRLAVPQTLGPTGALLVAEADMLRYALLGWGAAPEVPAGATAFSTHRQSGFMAMASMVGVVLAVEMGVVHLLASHWNGRLAGWLLLAEAYGLVLLVAHCQAVRLRPTLLHQEVLQLHVGFVWQLVVPVAEVVAIHSLRDNPAPAPGLRNLTKPLFTPANLLLTFAQPVVLQGPYGLRRTARRLAIYLDEPQQFIAAFGTGAPRV